MAIVRLQIVYHPAREIVRLRKFVLYLKKVGKGADGGESPHFTRAGEAVDLDGFYARLTGDGWAFMVIVSPDPTHAPDLPLQRYAQAWMLAIEQRLGGRKVDWVASVHYDTPEHLHIQMLWRGRDLAGKPLRLSRDLISHELRALADRVEDWY